MDMKIDGRKLAKEIEERVKVKVREMKIRPRIVSVLVGSDPASELYIRLKKQVAERVGIEFEIYKINGIWHTAYSLQKEIQEIGKREDVDEVMVQMPIPGLTREEQGEVVKMIPLKKDVDGLRWEESGIQPATVRAIFAILEKIVKIEKNLWKKKFVVVGARGMVGKPLVHYLRERGVEVSEVEWDTEEPTRMVLAGEVVISCVGKEGVVTGNMVHKGAIVIDVGSPKGDMTREVYEKASISVEVPGGVGPVTVVSLMENVVGAVDGL